MSLLARPYAKGNAQRDESTDSISITRLQRSLLTNIRRICLCMCAERSRDDDEMVYGTCGVRSLVEAGYI